MSTDRKLLELAAKAAGIKYEWHPGCGDALRLTAPDAKAIYWNPLADDGDALRLAVKMGLDTHHREVVWTSLAGRGTQVSELYRDDRYAATRRTIVRAAAKIGEAMP